MDSSTNWWRPPEQTGPGAAAPSETATRRIATPETYGLVFWALIGFTTIMLLGPQHRFPVLAPLRLALLSFGIAIVAYYAEKKGLPRFLRVVIYCLIALQRLFMLIVIFLPYGIVGTIRARSLKWKEGWKRYMDLLRGT